MTTRSGVRNAFLASVSSIVAPFANARSSASRDVEHFKAHAHEANQVHGSLVS